jgi:AcrR family transcriptional regulator
VTDLRCAADVPVTSLLREQTARQRAVRSAIAFIDAEGEHAVRLADVARESGVGISSLYHYFAGRDALLAEAQVVRYGRALRQGAAELSAVVGGATDAQSFRRAFELSVSGYLGAERAPARADRVSALGSAYGKPELAESLIAAQSRYLDGLAVPLGRAQRQGWMHTDLDARTLAALISGVLLGRSLIEMIPTGVDGDEWDRNVSAMLHHAAFGSDAAEKVFARPRPVRPTLPNVPAVHDVAEAASAPTATREKLLGYAADLLDRRGDSGLRVLELADEADVSVATLYHHFGSRDGLVAAAHAERFMRSTHRAKGTCFEALDRCGDEQTFDRIFDSAVRGFLSPVGASDRMTRLHVLAGTHGRPALEVAVAAEQRVVWDQLAGRLEDCQIRGWLRPGLDRLAFVATLSAVVFGRTPLEIGPLGVDVDARDDAVVKALRWLAAGHR